jgi:hypothetical protein
MRIDAKAIFTSRPDEGDCSDVWTINCGCGSQTEFPVWPTDDSETYRLMKWPCQVFIGSNYPRLINHIAVSYWSALRWTGKLCGINPHIAVEAIFVVQGTLVVPCRIAQQGMLQNCVRIPTYWALCSLKATKIQVLMLYPAASGMPVTPSFTSSTRDTSVCVWAVSLGDHSTTWCHPRNITVPFVPPPRY